MPEHAEPRQHAARRWLALGAGLALLVIVGARQLFVLPAAVAQPVAFNHRVHTEQLKIACQLCHPYVTTGAHAGLPDTKTCALCHSVKQGTSAESARLTALLAHGDTLAFKKLFHLAPYVFFTHERHVGIAKLACQDCHGAIALTDRPPTRPLVTIRMAVCLGCHVQRGQSTDCVACHR
jgi:hypothetical protein